MFLVHHLFGFHNKQFRYMWHREGCLPWSIKSLAEICGTRTSANVSTPLILWRLLLGGCRKRKQWLTQRRPRMYTTIYQAIISLRKRNRASTYRCPCIPMLATLTENRPVHVAAFRFTIRAVYNRSVISGGSLPNVYIYVGLVFSSVYSAQWHH